MFLDWNIFFLSILCIFLRRNFKVLSSEDFLAETCWKNRCFQTQTISTSLPGVKSPDRLVFYLHLHDSPPPVQRQVVSGLMLTRWFLNCRHSTRWAHASTTLRRTSPTSWPKRGWRRSRLRPRNPRRVRGRNTGETIDTGETINHTCVQERPLITPAYFFFKYYFLVYFPNRPFSWSIGSFKWIA